MKDFFYLILGANNRLANLLLAFFLLVPRISWGQEISESPVKNVEGQRVLGELCGTYTFKNAFPRESEMTKDAYLQLWRTDANTPQGQADSLTISCLETIASSEICDGKKFLTNS